MKRKNVVVENDIHRNAMISHDDFLVKETRDAIIIAPEKGIISFSFFALAQLNKGIMNLLLSGSNKIDRLDLVAVHDNVLDDWSSRETSLERCDDFNNGEARRLLKGGAPVENMSCEVVVTREEVLTMIKIISLRMEHCEFEREAGNPRFSEDTYIGMKMFLLDLKAWVMGEVVSFGRIRTKEEEEEVLEREY
jgi:hypothetical protein